MVLVRLLDIMPKVSSRYGGLGVGFAPYLQPPGPEVVRWTVGEPGFNTPSEIINAAVKELNNGNTKYTRGAGSIELCQSVADYLFEKHGIETEAENVVITPGAKRVSYTHLTLPTIYSV